MQGPKQGDYRRASGQRPHKYDGSGEPQAGSPLYSPYSEGLGTARLSSASTKHLRHSSSLPSSRHSLHSLSYDRLTGLTRSQLAEEKQVRRQSSISDTRGSPQQRAMSAERSRPSTAASQRSKQYSSWESSSGAIKRLSGNRSDVQTADTSKHDENGHLRSTASSHPVSPGPSPHTIAAYNPLGRISYTNPSQQTSRHSLGATSSSAPDPTHLSSSTSSAPLRRSSTGVSMGGHPYAAQASASWDQEHQMKRKTAPAEQGAGPQDFLSQLERSKGARDAGASYGVPKRTNSNPRELFERSGQFIYSLGDKFMSMTQRSPPRRTSSSSASAVERDRPDHAGQEGMTDAAAERAAQRSSSHYSLQAASHSRPDPGHLFSMEKMKRHDRLSDSILKNDKAADAMPSSGFRAHAFDSSRNEGGYGQPSMSASALTSSKCGPLTKPTVGSGSSQHVAAAATAQSSKSAGGYSETHSSDEQPRRDTLPGQGIKSLGLSTSQGLNGSQTDTLPVPKFTHASVGSSNTASRLDKVSNIPAGTVRQGTQQAVSASSQHSMLLADDDAASLPHPASEATSEAASITASRAAAQPVSQASGAESPASALTSSKYGPVTNPTVGLGSSQHVAAAPSQRAADSLSQMHQSMRKANLHARGVSSQQLSAAISSSGAAFSGRQHQDFFVQSGAGATRGVQAGVLQHAQPSDPAVPAQFSTTSNHMTGDSSHMTDRSPTASAQEVPSIPASTARQLASELAASVTLSPASQDQSSSASVAVAQGMPQQLQGTSHGPWHPLVARDRFVSDEHGDPQLLLQSQTGLPFTSSSAAASEVDDSQSASYTNKGHSERPAVVHSPGPQPSGSIVELKEAIELSLSQGTVPHELFQQELQHSHDTGHAAELPQPSLLDSPSRQLSASSPELNEAIRMSLSAEFLPEAEPKAASPLASHSELQCSVSQHGERDLSLSQLPAASPTASSSASGVASAMESSGSLHLPKTPGAQLSHLEPSQFSASDPSSSASDAEPMHKHERQSHAVEHFPAGPGPTPQHPASPNSSPSMYGSEAKAAPSSPAGLVRADGKHMSNSSAATQTSSQGESEASSTHKGHSQYTPAPDASLPSSFGRTTPAPIHTSSSPKPPNPSPGTAAQIDGDAALARQLQKLELGNEAAANESSPSAPAADAVDADVDLAALQDVEVPLVGDQLPLAALVEDYEGSPRVCGNLVPLMQRFPYFRRIRGDGNCFYRAFMMAFVEDICLDPNTAKCRILLAVFERLYNRVKKWDEGVDDNYFSFVRKGYHTVREMIFKIYDGQMDLEDVMALMCSSRVDSYLVHLLRAITANELWRKQDHYKTFIPGIDAYGGLEMVDIIVQAVLPMGTEVEHLQVEALVATLPMCLKILDVAGSAASIYTFEPGSDQGTASQAVAPPTQQLWLIYRPGHYEIVYPQAGCEGLEKL